MFSPSVSWKRKETEDGRKGERNEKMRGLFSLVLCVIMLLMSVPFAGATDGSEADTVLNESAMDAYVQSVLPHYLSLENDNVYGEIAVSQGYVVHGHNDPNARTYFVTDDGAYIGKLMVTYSGGFFSTFSFGNNDFLSVVLQSERPIALLAIDEKLVLQIDNTNYIISSEDMMILNIDGIPTYPACVAQLAGMELLNVHAASTLESSYYKGLSVPFVENETINDRGQCWAACVAAISNFENGTSYTTVQLYNTLQALYSGTPSGSWLWNQRAYSYCSFNSERLRITYSPEQIYASLYQGTPLQINIYDDVNDDVGHALVIRSIHYNSSTVTLGFMDCNDANGSATYMTMSIGGNFVYVGASGTYRDWRYTITHW